MSELTTAASLAGSRVNLANSAPPEQSCAGRSSAVVAPSVLYARRLPTGTYGISRLWRCPGPACACHCDTRASRRRTLEPAAGLSGEGAEQPGRRDGDLADARAEVGDRVLDGVRDGRGAGDGAALADALDAERVDGRRVLVEGDRERRQLVGLRDRVVHQASGEELTTPVVHDFFHEPGADTLRRAALELRLHDHRIDGATRIVNDRVGEQADLARLDVDLDRGGVRAERPGDGVGIEIGARVQAGLAGGLERLRLHRGVRDLA